MKQQFKVKALREWRYISILLHEQGFKWKDSGLNPRQVPFDKLIKDHKQVIILIDHKNKTIDRAYTFDAFEGSIVSRQIVVKRLKGGYANEVIKRNNGGIIDGSAE